MENLMRTYSSGAKSKSLYSKLIKATGYHVDLNASIYTIIFKISTISVSLYFYTLKCYSRCQHLTLLFLTISI